MIQWVLAYQSVLRLVCRYQQISSILEIADNLDTLIYSSTKEQSNT